LRATGIRRRVLRESGLALADPIVDRECQHVVIEGQTTRQRVVRGLQSRYFVLELTDADAHAPKLGHHPNVEIIPNMTE
jgi:hypothetical protein